MTNYLKIPLILIYLSLIFFFYFKDLGYENTNEDQFRWYDRTQKFFEAGFKGDFASTYQQYHPGIFFIYLQKAGIEAFKISSKIEFNNFREIPKELFPKFNFYTKLFVVIFILFSIFISYLLIKESYGKFISLAFITYLCFDTYFIGLTRNLHMDSILAICCFVALISFYKALETKNYKLLLLSGIYSGFGLLTKSVFGLALVFMFFMTLFFVYKNKSKLEHFKMFLLNLLIACSIFVGLFPSMWVNPLETLSKIYLKGALSTGLGGDDNFTHYVNGYALPDPGPKFYFHILNFRLSPLIYFSILLILSLSLFNLIRSKKINLKTDKLIIFLIMFVLAYLAIIIYSSKKTDRYISLIYPPISLIVAFYLKLTWVNLKSNFFKIVFIFFGMVTLVINFLIHPFYFAYYNPLFGGIKEAQKRIYINQGGNAYLLLIKELDQIPVRKISAVNYEEITYASIKPVYPLNYYNFEEPNFIKVILLQRGENLVKNSKLIKTINILNQPYWRIYE